MTTRIELPKVMEAPLVYTANQPLLFPSIYMMNRYYHSDVLVIMEEAQFTKFGHQSRVEIINQGRKQYLTVPLKDRDFKPLNEVEVDNPHRTAELFKKTLQAVYGKFEAYKSMKDRLYMALGYAAHSSSLAEFNHWLLLWCFDELGFSPMLVKSTIILPNRPEHPSEWVAELGAGVGAEYYIGGGAAQSAYIRQEDFDKYEIKLVPQNYKMPPYLRDKKADLWIGTDPTKKDGWVSILDPLFIGGRDLAVQLISQPAY